MVKPNATISYPLKKPDYILGMGPGFNDFQNFLSIQNCWSYNALTCTGIGLLIS